MYEIWLVMNIAWEIALGIWPLLAIALLAWLALATGALLRRTSQWRRSLPPAIGIAAIGAVALFLSVPGMTRSSLGELGYWVDWANLLAIALAGGGAVLAFAWPLLSLRQSRGI